MAAIINPFLNRKKTAVSIKVAERISRWVATFTTGIGGGFFGYSTALGYLPEAGYSRYLAAAAGLAVAVVLGWLTDHAFGDLLQRVVTDIVAAKHPNAKAWEGERYFKRLRRVESWGFGLVLLALFGFDAYTTLVIRDPVADGAKKIEMRDIAAATGEFSSEQKSAVSPMASQIRSLKSDIAEAERRTEASNPALLALAREGNGWAKSQMAQKKKSATKTARAELEKLNTAYGAALSGQSEVLGQAQRLINEENARSAEANQRNRNVMAGMYTAMTVAPKLLSIILRVLMVVTFFAYSQGLSLDLNGDGVFDYTDVQVYYENMLREHREAVARAQQRRQANDFDDIPRRPNPFA